MKKSTHNECPICSGQTCDCCGEPNDKNEKMYPDMESGDIFCFECYQILGMPPEKLVSALEYMSEEDEGDEGL